MWAKIKNYDQFYIPFAFTVLVGSLLLLWLKLDQNLPHWDMGRHLWTVLQYREVFHQFLIGEKSIFGLISFYAYYPPLVHEVSLIFQKIFGFSQDIAVSSNILWLFVLLFSLYGIAKEIFDKKAAVASLFVLISCPLLIGQIREFQIDFPLTAIVSLSYYFLLKSKHFSDKKYSIFLGISLGLGMMTKWTFVAFLIVPILWEFTEGLLNSKIKKQLIFKNILYIIIIMFCLDFFWYWRNLESIQHDFSANGIAVAKLEGDPTGINEASIRWYFDRLIENYLFFPLFISFCFGSLRLAFNGKIKFIIWFLAIYVVFSLLPNKDVRYILPSIVLISLIIGSLTTLKNKRMSFIVFAFLVAIALLNNYYTSYAKYLPYKYEPIYLLGKPVLMQNGYTSGDPVLMPICPMNMVIDSIPPGAKARLIGTNLIDFNDWAVAYNLSSHGRLWSGQVGDPFDLSDYLIIRQLDEENIYNQYSKFNQYQAVSIVPCEDQSKVIIYKIK